MGFPCWVPRGTHHHLSPPTSASPCTAQAGSIEPSGAAPLGKRLGLQGAVGLLANPDAGKDLAGKRYTSESKPLSNRSVDEKSWPSSADGLCRADPQGTPTRGSASRPVSVGKAEVTPGHHLGELQPAAAARAGPAPRSAPLLQCLWLPAASRAATGLSAARTLSRCSLTTRKLSPAPTQQHSYSYHNSANTSSASSSTTRPSALPWFDGEQSSS